MIRRETFDAVGLLDEGLFMYGDDVDWCRRAWNAGWEVVFFPGACAIHDRGKITALIRCALPLLSRGPYFTIGPNIMAGSGYWGSGACCFAIICFGTFSEQYLAWFTGRNPRLTMTVTRSSGRVSERSFQKAYVIEAE